MTLRNIPVGDVGEITLEVVSEVLSDGSRAYNVRLGFDLEADPIQFEIACQNEAHANAMRREIGNALARHGA